MMVIGAMLIGAIVGGAIARRHGGKGLDIAQYAGSMGIAFGIVGLIAAVVIERAAS